MLVDGEVTYGNLSLTFELNTATGETILRHFTTTECCAILFESLSSSNPEADNDSDDMNNDTSRALADFVLRYIIDNSNTLSQSETLVSKCIALSSYVVLTNAVSVRRDGSLQIALRCMYTPTAAPSVGSKRPRKILSGREESSFGSEDLQGSLFELESVKELIGNLLSSLHDSKIQLDLRNHCKCVLDQCYLRKTIEKMKAIAFVGNGSILPRNASAHSTVVPFLSPESLQCTIHLPHRGSITGMLVPAGVTGNNF